MATCMVEGIDPIQMCRELMSRIADSEQLKSEADPSLLILFQDWLERLEEEAAEIVSSSGSMCPKSLSDQLGISQSGGAFLISRLKNQGKL